MLGTLVPTGSAVADAAVALFGATLPLFLVTLIGSTIQRRKGGPR